MTQSFIITGTDTNVGKTVFAASLMLALSQSGVRVQYWKPVQCGIEEIDTRTIQKITALDDDYFLPEKYILSEPLSPHRAAEMDGVHIDVDTLEPPDHNGILLIEGAGGIHVPLTRTTLYSDLFALWRIPVILCARTGLGTLNHTLLSIEALKSRNIPIHGLVFIGEDNPDNIRTITDFSGQTVLGRLPLIDSLDDTALLKAFEDNFNLPDFMVSVKKDF